MRLPLDYSTIRSLEASDAGSIAANANDRDVWLHLRDVFPHPYALEDAKSYLDLVEKDEDSLSFAIDVGGVAVGGIAAHRQADVHRLCVEIGYWIGRDYWGRGIMSEVVRAFTEYLIEEQGFYRVFAVPFSGHPASERVLQKAGFVSEGITRASVFKDGQVLDQTIYAKLSEDAEGGIAPSSA